MKRSEINQAIMEAKKMMEEYLANFSVFHIGTGLKMDNNEFAAGF